MTRTRTASRRNAPAIFVWTVGACSAPPLVPPRETQGQVWLLPPARAALMEAGRPIRVSIPQPVTTASVVFDTGRPCRECVSGNGSGGAYKMASHDKDC